MAFVVSARRVAFCVVAVACFSVLGCSHGEELPELVPVSGKITIDGKPLANASIVFMPADPKEEEGLEKVNRPHGTTNEAGEYELEWNENAAGAPPGQYKVIVMAVKPMADEDGEGMVWLIPQKYGNPRTSGLSATVKDDGDSDLNFDLAG